MTSPARLRRGLERLEEVVLALQNGGAQWPAEEWPLDDQLEQVADMLDFFMHFHSKDAVRYVATDREIHLLGLLCAAWELGEDGGEYTFLSGLTVRLIREGESFLIDTPRQRIGAEDLPDWTLEHFERMDPEKQAERERWLFEHRHDFEPWQICRLRLRKAQFMP